MSSGRIIVFITKVAVEEKPVLTAHPSLGDL